MSSSAMIGMTSVTVGVLFKSGMNIWAAVLLGLAAALAAGLFNGWLVGELNIAPMLATLGTMTLYQGIGLALSKGDAISGFPEDFLMLGQGYLAGIPLQLFLLAALVILMTVVMNKGRFGRKVYLIRTDRFKICGDQRQKDDHPLLRGGCSYGRTFRRGGDVQAGDGQSRRGR